MVKTTWKYSMGSRSSRRASSHLLPGPFEHSLNSAGIERLVLRGARKQPGLGPVLPPVLAQAFEQLGGQHDVALRAALAVPDADAHQRAVDVSDLKRQGFRQAQPTGVEGHQQDAVLGVLWRSKQGQDLAPTQHQRQRPLAPLEGQQLLRRRPPQDPAVEEAQRSARLVVQRGGELAHLDEMQQVRSGILRIQPIRQSAEVLPKLPQSPAVAGHRLGAVATQLELLLHALVDRFHHGPPFARVGLKGG